MRHMSFLCACAHVTFHDCCLACVTQDETGVWERRLAILAEGLQVLNAIQRKWVYLEPIFARGALPNEQPRFRRVQYLFMTSLHCISNNTSSLSYALLHHAKAAQPELKACCPFCLLCVHTDDDVLCVQIDDQFQQLLSGTEGDPMVVHFADIPRIMVNFAMQLSNMP